MIYSVLFRKCIYFINNTLHGCVHNMAVLKPHERAAPAVSSVPTLMVARKFSTSVLLQEQRDEYRSLLHMSKEDITSLVRHLVYA